MRLLTVPGFTVGLAAGALLAGEAGCITLADRRLGRWLFRPCHRNRQVVHPWLVVRAVRAGGTILALTSAAAAAPVA